MKPRPRWEVRRFSWNVLAARCGLPCTPHMTGTSMYRWRWMARFAAFLATGHAIGFAYWAEVHRAPPKLRVVEVQPTRPWPRTSASFEDVQ